MKKKILYVEDHDEVRKMIKMNLELEGYLVETARDGLEALKKLKEEKFALVITDLEMPRMNGWELCEKIKGDPETKKIPIIALSIISPHSLPTLKAEAHLVKPFALKDLYKEISRLTSP